MNQDDIYSCFGYALIVVLMYLIYRTLFPKKIAEGFLGLFDETDETKSEEKDETDDPAVKRIEENVKELQEATNKTIKQMNLVKNRSHWENLIIAMEDRISSVSLQSLAILASMIKTNPNDEKLIKVMEKLNSFEKFRDTLKENMKYLDGLK